MPDTGNHIIRKITAAGQVSTFAGTAGSRGSADGIGTAARFDSPFGIGADNSGNVYVADTGNHAVRKITPARQVNLLAGAAGSIGSEDGVGAAARFHSPRALAVDGAGNIYVADTGNSTIRKVAPNGQVTTLAGTAGVPGSADASSSNATFTAPCGIALDVGGRVFVADSKNNVIRVIDPPGRITTYAGLLGRWGFQAGSALAAGFFRPRGLATDSPGNLYVADSDNPTIRKVSAGGFQVTP